MKDLLTYSANKRLNLAKNLQIPFRKNSVILYSFCYATANFNSEIKKWLDDYTAKLLKSNHLKFY